MMADVADMSIDELAESFELLGDWESRYSYLIDLGKQLSPMNEGDKCEANKVHGCQAQVWMKFMPGADGRIDIVADSDAFIVRGLIAVLLMIYSGRAADEILNTDGSTALERLQLAAHLSPTRKNGLFAMVERIRELAAARSADAVN